MEAPFWGKIAIVDLAKETVLTESVDLKLYRKLLGGKGLGVYLLIKYLSPGTDPLSEDNVIVFATGPLTGSHFPSSSRMVAVTKSPLTGTFLDTNGGGYLGREIKATGWDAIVITGRANKLSYLSVRNERVEFKDALHLRRADVETTEASIRRELGDERIAVVSIGLAGEEKVLFANANCAGGWFGRGGLGAVMGSKHLKAVAVRGTNSLPWEGQRGFKEAVEVASRKVREHPALGKKGNFHALGTWRTVDATNSFGVLPTMNWQRGTFSEIEGVWPPAFVNTKVKPLACHRCHIACKRLAKVTYKGEDFEDKGGPEYETIFSIGPNCGVSKAESVIRGDCLLNQYGLDSISTGGTLAFVMECYQRGIVTKNDLDGIDLAFGKDEEMWEMVSRIASGQGVGKLLGQGASRVSKKLGSESHHFAMTIKGLELAGYDPRGMKAQAVVYATADRGGCHTRGNTLLPELYGIPEKVDRFSYDGKARLAADLHRWYVLLDCLSTCIFATFALAKVEDFIPALNSLFPNSWTVEELQNVGSRVWNLTRIFNCREGFGRKDDTLPPRLFLDPVPEGPSRGEVVNQSKFQQMLDKYYAIQGWDLQGMPKKTTLESLGISELL